MKHTAIIVMLALGGCAGAFDPSKKSVLEGGPSFVAPIVNPLVGHQAQFNIVNNSYGGALAVFVNFRDACADRVLPPTCRTAVQRTQPYIVRAERARQGAINFMAKYPTLNAVQAVEAFRDTVNDFKVIQMEQRIQ